MNELLDCRSRLPQAAPEASHTGFGLRLVTPEAVGTRRQDLRIACTERPPRTSASRGEILTDGANLALHVQDDPVTVRRRREALASRLGCGPIQWLDQQHTVRVLEDDELDPSVQPTADGSLVKRRGVAAALLTADCLPVVLWLDSPGAPFTVFHAGWQGLLGGILEAGVQRLRRYARPNSAMQGWLGPHVCAAHYEVDRSLAERFAELSLNPPLGFAQPSPRAANKVQLSLASLALAKLNALGVDATVATACSYSSDRYYSHRRAQHLGLAGTGRFATLAWLAD